MSNSNNESKNMVIFKRLILGMSFAAVLSLTSCGKKPDTPASSDSIYRLQFNDTSDLGKNTSKNSSFKSAKVVGNNFEISSKHKDSNVLTFKESAHDTNYLDLPADVLKNDNTTIAMWVKMPNVLTTDDSNRPLFGITLNSGYFYACPYDVDTWNSYALYAKFNSSEEVNLTKVSPSEKVYNSLAPLEGTLQPIPGAWQLIGFSFSENELTVYQNGKLTLTYSGNYSLKEAGVTSFKIGSANEATGKDFNGSITDVRIYNKILTEDDYQNEFSTKYTDFATLNMNFNDKNLSDTVRNYTGEIHEEAAKNVTFETKDNRQVVHLNGQGENNARSGFKLPQQALLGHNELSISTDIYVEPRKDQSYQYLRLFDFSSNDGKRFLSFYYTLYDTNRVRIEVIPNAEKEFEVQWVTKPDFWMPIKKWINITCVFEHQHIKIVVDGKVIAETKNVIYSPSFLYDFNNCNFYIGRPNNYGDHPLHCYLDNLKMYSVALTDSDIQDVMGHCHTLDDKEAVNKAAQNFDIKSCTRYGNGRIYPVSHLDDGVTATVTSLNTDVIDEDGYVLYKDLPQNCLVKVRLSRNGVSVIKDYYLTIPAKKKTEMKVNNNSFAKEEYAEGSYQRNMQEETFKWMVSLSNEKLLYSYRKIAGLNPTGESYGSWIREGCGGEGQFQSEYIGALARATNYTNSSYIDKIRTKLETLLTEIRECQVAYPDSPYGKYFDKDQHGYLNAFTHWCFYGMEHGLCNHVGYNKGPGAIKKEDGFNVPYDITIWVPFYMYHKQLMMCYDTYTYANMGDESKTNEIKQLAKTMFLEAADWMKREVLGLTEEERESALRVETGGMTEAMYYAYELTGDHDFFKAAIFFEEEGMIEELYANSNILSGIHVNTALPKLISCCAAYKVLGDPFYLKAAENVWDMMVDHMTMSNGGISSIEEHFEEPDHATQARFGEETCCSYNMLRLTDYLYRFTGDAKYMRFFERVFYNHILPSIDMVGSQWSGYDRPYSGDESGTIKLEDVQIAGKAYVMSTDFGHHITYSSNEDSFWCCVATGTESYSKLTYGNFYLDKANNIYINMYNNISCTTPSGATLTVSGIQNVDTTKGCEYVEISTNSSIDLTKLRLIKPEWVATNPVMTIGDTQVNYSESDGYMIPTGTLSEGTPLRITLPMKLNAVSQRGYQKQSEDQGEYSYSLYYGPYMIVPDLGSFPKQSGDDKLDIYIHTGNGSDQSGQRSYLDVYKDTHGGSTDGAITQLITFDGESYNNKITKQLVVPEVKDGHAYNSGLAFKFVTTNNGTLTFRPFMDINYERYSFYMYYNVPFNE